MSKCINLMMCGDCQIQNPNPKSKIRFESFKIYFVKFDFEQLFPEYMKIKLSGKKYEIIIFKPNDLEVKNYLNHLLLLNHHQLIFQEFQILHHH